MKDLNSENAFFENVSTDNLNFNSVNNDTPQSVNDVLAWNGSSWEVKAASDLGVGGGGGGGSTPSSFVSNIPAGVESHAITYGPFSSTPKIASSLEINGDGEIIPYTMSGVSATGYHAIFSDATPNANYNIHTVFGGESAGSSGGGLSYNEVVVTVSGAKFYIDGTQQLQLSLQRGLSYRFDQSDSTNSGHPIKFSTLSDGTHNTPAGSEYTAGIVYSGTPGSAGAYTEVTLSQSSPNLYYYCENHPQMGGSALGEIILKANGNVGIGTTNPAGTLELNSSSTDTNFYMGGTPSAGSREPWRFQAEGDILHIGQSKSSYAKYMTFFGSKVGIGATSPSHDLTLGSGTSAGTASTRLKIYRGADDPGQNLEMGYGHITVTRDSNALANPQSTFSIKQKGSDGERTAIHINTNGNVGIGTTSPNEPLHVVDSRVDVTGKPVLKLSSPTITSGMFSHSVHALNPNLITEQNQIIIVGKDNSLKNSGYVGYKWYGDGSDSNLLTFGHFGRDNLVNITPTGNVGIGTTNPSCRMNVQALSSAPWALCINRADSSGANSGRVFFDSSAGAWCIVNESGNFQLRWNGTPGSNSGTAKLQVAANANAWTAASDERLKENISEISNALDIIKDKRCSRFNYVDDSEKRKTVGFIAQDWVDDLPEIVNASKGLDVDDENDTDEYLGLEYQGVIPVLTKAIQEQQTMIEDLKARIETLES
jgi:hypothetical protein